MLILLLGLSRGLLYLAAMPPWQHYDEPSHMEVVRLIAERGRLPRPGDYDLEMRRAIAVSMRANGFWGSQTPPDLDLSSEEPPWIGISQLGDPPLYYALLALPQRLVQNQPIEVQLYVARACSVLLFLIVIAAAHGLVREAFPRRRGLPLAVAAAIALLPPFADLMSAVNNDVGAAAVTSLFLWAVVRLVCRGLAAGRLAPVVLLAVACLITKNTAGIVAGAVLVALALSYVPCRQAAFRLPARRRPHETATPRGEERQDRETVPRQGSTRARRHPFPLACAGPALLALALGAILLSGRGRAADWYSGDSAEARHRVKTATPAGRYAFYLSKREAGWPHYIFQELKLDAGRSLRGRVVTFGAWIRVADDAKGVVALNLTDGKTNQWHRVEATPEWEFYGFTATIDEAAAGVAVYVLLTKAEGSAEAAYVDGLILAEGDLPIDPPPVFSDRSGTGATWAGQAVTNLLHNGSAERAWPQLPAWLGKQAALEGPLADTWYSSLDVRRTGWVYRPVIRILFRSFWGGFAWNHLALPDAAFWPLALVTLVGGSGAVLGLWRLHRVGWLAQPAHRRLLAMLAVALLAAWGSTILRVHPIFLTRRSYWPVARYAAVSIVPGMALLLAGWGAWLPRRWHKAAAWAGLLAMLLLEALAWWGVLLPFYYGG